MSPRARDALSRTNVSRFLLISATVWLFAGAWLTSDGGTSIPDLLGLEVCAIVIALLWLASAIVRVVRTKSIRGWLNPSVVLIPLVLAVGTFITWCELGLSLRFTLSRPQLERYARSVSRSHITSNRRVRVGLFTVSETEALGNGVVRLITSECMFDDCGLALSPGGPPPRVGEDSYQRITGDWYHWWRSW